jgi:glycine/D-amino acid oxidase-like deaminating enzyme
MPADEQPIIGALPGAEGLYVTVMHAGISLAAVVGRLSAVEIVDGIQVGHLDAYRPSRFRPGDRPVRR